jgi:hypothetical protein
LLLFAAMAKSKKKKEKRKKKKEKREICDYIFPTTSILKSAVNSSACNCKIASCFSFGACR